ncbi:MAG TPA: Stp1/IreP family PP2C-type Ser/Thr phosphatase [Ilumatobacteraceae bacterium]|nr:Stp1/IreP family PP2C-type Ser/Thr phosphatase [Ilumatobacteraceae bacterium]
MTTSLPTLAWGASTHPGRVREGNEDAFVAEPMVFVVADGMGGHQAGEVASAIAAKTLHDRLGNGAATIDVAVAAVVEANAAIFQAAHTNLDQRGMGTTLTAMVVLPTTDAGARLAVLNVGDSRTYVLRGGRLRRISVDHSYVQELVSTGHISEAEARNHPRRNIVTRALGIEPSVRVDTWVLPFVRGDRYVLCSDGLVDEVDDREIADVLAVHASPQAAAEALVDVALRHGGRDNVTVVVVDSLEGDEPPRDDSDLNIDLSWDEAQVNERLAERLVDAEAGSPPATDPTPVGAPVPHRGILSRGVIMFGVALAAIVTATVVLLVSVGGNDSPAPTTTTTSTTVRTTTTTAPTSTTIRTSTTANFPTTTKR